MNCPYGCTSREREPLYCWVALIPTLSNLPPSPADLDGYANAYYVRLRSYKIHQLHYQEQCYGCDRFNSQCFRRRESDRSFSRV
ncbi:hypothetical protein [Nostoc sp.]|uniref:hypothetical protein n=1 Tax=Nostoc sp. TaxID=1180 RepID=UPI002FFC074F